jgi:hypothetical protein
MALVTPVLVYLTMFERGATGTQSADIGPCGAVA